ncbi:hypothetical protein Tco_1490446 [Tanacetum coccineum]
MPIGSWPTTPSVPLKFIVYEHFKKYSISAFSFSTCLPIPPVPETMADIAISTICFKRSLQEQAANACDQLRLGVETSVGDISIKLCSLSGDPYTWFGERYQLSNHGLPTILIPQDCQPLAGTKISLDLYYMVSAPALLNSHPITLTRRGVCRSSKATPTSSRADHNQSSDYISLSGEVLCAAACSAHASASMDAKSVVSGARQPSVSNASVSPAEGTGSTAGIAEESAGASEYDMPVCDDFMTFSNPLFDFYDDSTSSDDELFSDEDVPKENFKIYLNPLFDEEIISTKIDPHHFNAKSDLIESLLNRDTSIVYSPMFDSLLEEFFGELAYINLISPKIDEADFDPEEEIRLVEKLLYDNSSPRPSEELNSKNPDAVMESISPSPIPVEGSDSLMEEINIFLAPDDSIPPGIKNDDYDSEGDILEELLNNDSLSLPEN